MNTNKGTTLREAFRYTEKSLQTKLESAEFPAHPVAKGDVSEDAWRDLLSHFLPSRYCVETGFVVDAKNAVSKQIDCIIYDNNFTPTFWGERGYIYVPAESVHAVFEIKQEITKEYLRQTSEKIESVRILHRTSAPYTASGKEEEPKPLFHIIGGLLATKAKYIKGLNESRLNEAVHEIQQQDPKNKCIDIILTAFDGYADYFNTGFPTDNPYIDIEEGAATRGLFRLVKALLKQGTVSAIDLDYYHKNAFVEKKPRRQ